MAVYFGDINETVEHDREFLKHKLLEALFVFVELAKREKPSL